MNRRRMKNAAVVRSFAFASCLICKVTHPVNDYICPLPSHYKSALLSLSTIERRRGGMAYEIYLKKLLCKFEFEWEWNLVLQWWHQTVIYYTVLPKILRSSSESSYRNQYVHSDTPSSKSMNWNSTKHVPVDVNRIVTRWSGDRVLQSTSCCFSRFKQEGQA